MSATAILRHRRRGGGSLDAIGALRLLRTETRRSIGIWVFPVLALAGWWQMGEYAVDDVVVTWLETSHAIGITTVFLAPLSAGVAAWQAGRDRRRGASELLATTPRSPVVREALGWAGAAAWCLLAYVVAGLAVITTTGTWGVWGGPYLSFMIVGAASIVAATAIGHLAGAVIPSRFVPPLVLIVLYGALLYVGDNNPASYRYLSPLTFLNGGQYDVFYAVETDIAFSLTLWLLGLTLTALALTGIWRRRGFSLLPAVVCAAAVVLTAGSAVSLMRPTEGVYSPPAIVPYEPVCAQGVVQVCVHPAYATHLDEATQWYGRLVEPLLGVPGGPQRVEQLRTQQGLQPDGTLAVQLLPNAELTAIDAVRGLVYDPEMSLADGREAEAARIVVGRWLLRRVAGPEEWLTPLSIGAGKSDGGLELEITAAVDRFAALDPTGQRAWLDAHFADLRAGEVRLDDLP